MKPCWNLESLVTCVARQRHLFPVNVPSSARFQLSDLMGYNSGSRFVLWLGLGPRLGLVTNSVRVGRPG